MLAKRRYIYLCWSCAEQVFFHGRRLQKWLIHPYQAAPLDFERYYKTACKNDLKIGLVPCSIPPYKHCVTLSISLFQLKHTY